MLGAGVPQDILNGSVADSGVQARAEGVQDQGTGG